MTWKTALVTGASAGIGRELVRQLVLDRGFSVLATARRRDRLDELAAGLPEGRVHVLDGDLADPAFRARPVGACRRWRLPRGRGRRSSATTLGFRVSVEFSDQPVEAWRAIIEVNVVALMDLTQRAMRHMKARKSGQIVEVSSILGTFGIPYSAAYVASKHAVVGLVK